MTIDVPQAPPLATVPGVELVQAGQWDLSSGRVTFTRGDLASAVAALDCPAVRRPVLKLGHVDPRFDGEPAVGWVENMALAGSTITGDYVGMPGWLGDVIASAFPDRSIEGVFDHRCQLGHTHPFVITAVALLGVSAPGVGTLDSLQDVAALYGVVNASATSGEPVTITIRASKENVMPNPRPVEVAAGVSSEDVRRAYYERAPYSVWICEMQLDPLQLITIDDESGQYARVPITLAGDGFEFGDPVPVVIQYVDKPATTTTTAASALVFASRAESRPDAPLAGAQTPPVEPAAGPTPNEGGHVMPLDEGLRQRLGLAEDADEDTILSALDEALTERAENDKPTVTTPEGTVVIDETALTELREQAAEGVAARAEQRRQENERVVEEAIKAGKVPPARRDHWRQALAVDADGAKEALASLAPGLVPLADNGSPGAEPNADEHLYASLFGGNTGKDV